MTKQSLYTRVLVDAGPLVAILGVDDQYHEQCSTTLQYIVPPLLTSWLAVAEAAYLLRKSAASIDTLMAGPACGLYRILSLAEEELPAMAVLMRKFRKLGPQLADISLIHLAERESLETVFTLDRRDFLTYRTSAGKRLQLLPTPS